MREDKYLGRIFDDYIVVEKIPYYYNTVCAYRIRCLICGHEKLTSSARLRESNFKHSLMKCEETYLERDILNKDFGDMKVINYKRGVGENKRTELLVKCNICGCERLIDHSEFIVKKSGHNHTITCVRYLKLKEDNPKLYDIWHGMKARCENVNNHNYKYYGERGIKCLYQDFMDFYNDMHESYLKHCEMYGDNNTTIERIDVNGNYEKFNLKWATKEEQNCNRRNNRLFKVITPNGEVLYSKTIKGFTRENNLPFASVRKALNTTNYYNDWYFEYVDNE